MLERTLKTLLAVMLMLFFVQRVIFPVIEESRQASDKLSEVKISLKQMASDEQNRIKKIQQTERMMLSSHFYELSRLLPDFNQNRSAAVSRLELLRDRYSGNWQIQPGTQLVHEDNMVRWPVRLSFTGEFTTAMKVLKHLETGESLNRIATLDIAPARDGMVELVINMEMLFSQSESEEKALAANVSFQGGSM